MAEQNEQLDLWREAMGLEDAALESATHIAYREQVAADKAHKALQQRIVVDGIAGLHGYEKDFLRVLTIHLPKLSLRVSVLRAAMSLRELGLQVNGLHGAGTDSAS